MIFNLYFKYSLTKLQYFFEFFRRLGNYQLIIGYGSLLVNCSREVIRIAELADAFVLSNQKEIAS